MRKEEIKDKSYIIEILKERYEYEQLRRNNFDNAINLPITILGLLVGGLAAIVAQKDLDNDVIQYGVFDRNFFDWHVYLPSNPGVLWSQKKL